ncbi:MAG: adenosylcobalamin-dependent ribonucleoside-diphosphate reductase [Balneolaceae bacterium]
MTLDGYRNTIFKLRYAISKNEEFHGDGACKRVGEFLANAENGEDRAHWAERFTKVLEEEKFSPAGRVWHGSGRPKPGLINCYVIPAGDSREGWGTLLHDVIVISGLGGGVGVNFSNIRPREWPIRGTGGRATGSVSLMKIVNTAADQLRAGGGRRAALMFALRYDHPDILEFVSVKLDRKEINLANISIIVDNEFINKVRSGDFITPECNGLVRIICTKGDKKWGRTVQLDKIDEIDKLNFEDFTDDDGTIPTNIYVDRYKADWLWAKMVDNAWESAEPGILNFSFIEGEHNMWYSTPVSCTNPCGEQGLPEYSSCDLGAVNLVKHIIDGKIDWDSLSDTITVGVRMLDNVLDMTHYPLQQIADMAQRQRRIGLGVMGLHHAMLLCGVKYDSEEGLQFVDTLFKFIKREAYEASVFLAVQKGEFPDLDRQKFLKSGFCKRLPASLKSKIKEYGIRNATLLTCAPTGTTSIVAGVSSGIEPIFAPAYIRRHIQGEETKETVVTDPLFQKFLDEGKDVSHFVGSHDISPEWHLKMQVAIQKHIDASISKTINFDGNRFSKDDLSKLLLDNIHQVKGTTFYREGSRGEEPLQAIPVEEALKRIKEISESQVADNSCQSGKCQLT